MIEAVNSVLQSAPVLRSSTEQTSTTDSYAANPDRVQKFAQPGYISPYYTESGTSLVLEIRNVETGKVLDKIPSRPTPPTRKTGTTDAEATKTTSSPQQTYQPAQVQTTTASAPTTAHTSSEDSQVGTPYSQSFAAFAAAQQAGNSSTGQGNVSLYA